MTTKQLAMVAALAMLAAGTTRSAQAQDYAAERSGLTASIGAGPGSSGISCSPRCQGDRLTGPVVQLRGAAHVAAQFTIALEGNFFRRSFPIASGTGRSDLRWVTLGALWYPRVEEDIYVKLGIGIGTIRSHVTFPEVGALQMSANDLGTLVGIGRDFRVTESLAVTLYADFLSVPRSTAFISRSDSGARIGADVLSIGLALTLY